MNAGVSELVGRVSTRRFRGTACSESSDAVAIEEPLELCIGGEAYTVTMRTPGHDHELAAGLLLSERLIGSGEDLDRLFHCGRSEREESGNTLNVRHLARSQYQRQSEPGSCSWALLATATTTYTQARNDSKPDAALALDARRKIKVAFGLQRRTNDHPFTNDFEVITRRTGEAP